MTRKNEIHAFDDVWPIEIMSQKNDSSLFCVSSHSKKRPNTLVMGRLFDYQMLDMLELGIQNFKSIQDFKGNKCGVGLKPLFLFNGHEFTQNPTHMLLKSLLLDIFLLSFLFFIIIF